MSVGIQRQSFSDVSDWLTCLDQSHAVATRSGWEFVIVLAAGVDQFGRDNDAKKAELYKLASDQLNLAESTLKSYVSTLHKPSSQVAIERGLEIGHAKAVLGLEHEQAVAVLEEAAVQRMSVERTRYTAHSNRANGDVTISYPVNAEFTRVLQMAKSATIQFVMEKVNRLRLLTTVGLCREATIVAHSDHPMLARYVNITADTAAWARADHVALVWSEVKNGIGNMEERMRELEQLYPDCTRKQLEKAGRTAEEWPVNERHQGYYVRYAHHELLNMRSREERAEYLSKAEQLGFTAQRLEAELRGMR